MMKMFQPIVCIAMAAAWFCGCSTPAPKPQPVEFEQAAQLAAEAASISAAHNWIAAETTWGQVATNYALLDRRDWEAIALHNQAHAAFMQQKYETALALANKAAAINCWSNEGWRDQILILQIEKKLSPERWGAHLTELLAEGEASGLANVNPWAWAMLLNEKGVWSLAKGELTLAKLSLDEAMTTVHGDAVLALAIASNLAFCSEAEQEYEPALQAWNQVLETAKQLPHRETIASALAGRGRCLCKQGKEMEGLINLRRAADNYNRLGMQEESLRTLQEACQYLSADENAEELEKLTQEINTFKVEKK